LGLAAEESLSAARQLVTKSFRGRCCLLAPNEVIE
jgi:hypothetical protein